MSDTSDKHTPEDNAKKAIEAGLVEFLRNGATRRTTMRSSEGQEDPAERYRDDLENNSAHGC